MNVSRCCGAQAKVVTRSDHPYFYDDLYDLRVPALICTKCGKILNPHSIEADKGEKQ